MASVVGKQKIMKKESPLLAYFKDVTIVVIGVLIAVSVGNYKERLDNREYLKTTLVAIENEVTTSQGELETVLARHIALYEKLELEFSENEQPLGEFIARSGGFQVASIQNISLRFFISNKAELLRFEIISQLLDIEQQTSILSDKVDRLANFVYDHLHEYDEEVMVKFRFLLSDVIDSEQTLMSSYSEFLAMNQSDFSNKNE